MNRQENKELQEERKYSEEANSKWRKMNGDLFNFIISYQRQEKNHQAKKNLRIPPFKKKNKTKKLKHTIKSPQKKPSIKKF